MQAVYIYPENSDTANVVMIEGVPHICVKCGLLFPSAEELNEHYSEQALFQCGICSKRFQCPVEHEKNCKKTKRTRIKRYPPFICELCDKVFQQYPAYKAHSSIHMEQQYTCEECGKGYKKLSMFLKHCQRHREGHIKPPKALSVVDPSLFMSPLFECSEKDPQRCMKCGKKFTDMLAYQTHFLKHKKKKMRLPPYICPVCNKEFETNAKLYEHNMVHSDYRPYVCTICGKGYKKKSHMTRHLAHHMDEKPWHCTICDKRFIDRDTLKRHTWSHTGQKPFKCDQCDKQFNVRQSLLRHQRLHSDTFPYICEVCRKSFRSILTLKQHLYTHTQDYPFMCLICQKGFGSAKKLTRHGYTHLENELECYECGKRFTMPKVYQKHCLEHEELRCRRAVLEAEIAGESMNPNMPKKPLYFCDVCGKLFKSSTSLKDHRRRLGHNSNSTSHFGSIIGNSEHFQYYGDETPLRASKVSVTWDNKVSKTRSCFQQKKNEKFKCKACHEMFDCLKGFKKHYLIHKKQRKRQKQEKLTSSPISKKSLDSDQRTLVDTSNSAVNGVSRHSQEKNTFDCKLCDRKFQGELLYRFHYRTHHGKMSDEESKEKNVKSSFKSSTKSDTIKVLNKTITVASNTNLNFLDLPAPKFSKNISGMKWNRQRLNYLIQVRPL